MFLYITVSGADHLNQITSLAWLENLRADGIMMGEASTTMVTWKDRKTDSVRGQDPLIY